MEPGVERSGTPGIWRKYTSSPRSGRQLFVIRRIEIEPMAVARSAGLRDKCWTYLGLRCAPPQAPCCRPHPRAKIQHTRFVEKMWVKTRLYAAARVHWLRCYIIYSKTINAGLSSEAAPRQEDQRFKNP